MIVLLPLEGVVGGIGFLIAIGGYLLLDATKAHMLREGVVFTLAIIYALSIIMLLFKWKKGSPTS